MNTIPFKIVNNVSYCLMIALLFQLVCILCIGNQCLTSELLAHSQSLCKEYNVELRYLEPTGGNDSRGATSIYTEHVHLYSAFNCINGKPLWGYLILDL